MMYPINTKVAKVTMPLPIATLALFVVVIFLPGACWCGRPKTQVSINVRDIYKKDKRLDVLPYNTFAPRGLRWCGAECKRRPKCLSFNFVLAGLTCELLDKSSAEGSLMTQHDSFFADVSSWETFSDMIGKCDNFDCGPSGRCETNSAGDAVCFYSECTEENMPVVRNSLPGKPTSEVGFSITFTCEPGHQLQGNTSITCLSDGNWTSPKFKCKKCGSPPLLNNGYVLDGSRTLGAVRTYACNDGYTLQGSGSIRCDPNLIEWDEITFNCSGCPNPRSVTNAKLHSGPKLIGANRTYTCNTGFLMNGVGTITCQNDTTWTPVAFNCYDCGHPGGAHRATLLSGSNNVGRTRRYKCNAGYVMVGTDSVRCRANAKWTDINFTCVGCGLPPSKPLANVNNGGTTAGSVRKYTCKPHKVMEGNNTIVCQTNEIWTPVAFSCLPACGPPPTEPSATVNSGNTRVGSVRTYTCNGAKVMDGPNSISCLSTESWSDVNFKCLDDCGPPPAVQWASVDNGSTLAGYEREYTCDSSKELEGNNRIQCQAPGNWAAVAFSCEPACGPPPTVEGSSVNSGSTTVGSVREYTCDSPKVMNGTNSIECQASEEWTDVAFSCLAACGPPPTVEGTTVNSGSTTVGSVREYTCDSSKVMNGPNSIECQASEEWTDVAFSCEDVA